MAHFICSAQSYRFAQKSFTTKEMPKKKKNPCIEFLNFHIYKLIISVLYHCAAEFLKSDFTTASQ